MMRDPADPQARGFELIGTPAGDHLASLLEEAKLSGLLGPVPVASHLEHAQDLAQLVANDPSIGLRTFLDLGSGAGIPGLPLALLLPASRAVLLDVGERRTAFLHHAVTELGLLSRVEVVCAPAEVAARSHLRGSVELVVARSFAPPAVTCECAAPFLAVGGRLIVADRPEHREESWPMLQLGRLGLGTAHGRRCGSANFVTLQQERPCPVEFPRREGVPRKRPLF
jgi:16S rRNA (guanine527-N7)-methyltransferase